MSTLWRSLLLAWLGGASAPLPPDDAIALGLDQPAAVYQAEEQRRDIAPLGLPPPTDVRDRRS